MKSIETRNKIHLHYYSAKLRRNYINWNKHFHLAFQGGGAKGLAYVGAYKAIKEYPSSTIGQEEVPITSIMGSSAGGSIALAISTGIPEY